jgi:hypothetical protein
MDTGGWEFWVLRAALVVTFGTALVLADRLLSRVQRWLTWVGRFSILMGLSVLTVAYAWSRLQADNTERIGSLFALGVLGAIVGLFGTAISFVRWVDTWDHGLLKSYRPSGKVHAVDGGSPEEAVGSKEERQNPSLTVQEAKFTLNKAIELANEKLLIDRLYSVARNLESLYAETAIDNEFDDPDDEDYPLYGELNLSRSGRGWYVCIDYNEQAFELKFYSQAYSPKLDQCRHVVVQLGQHTLAELSYEPAMEEPSLRREWRATNVETLAGTSWLVELEKTTAGYMERGALLAGYRLRKSAEAEADELIERAKKIRLED